MYGDHMVLHSRTISVSNPDAPSSHRDQHICRCIFVSTFTVRYQPEAHYLVKDSDSTDLFKTGPNSMTYYRGRPLQAE